MNIERLRSKIEETDRERAAHELAHAQSSDYHTPPSQRVARLEGQIVAFKWLLGELEKEESILSDIRDEGAAMWSPNDNAADYCCRFCGARTKTNIDLTIVHRDGCVWPRIANS